MSMPLICATCRDVVGAEEHFTYTSNFCNEILLPCNGKGNHPKPRRSLKKRLFGLVTRVTLYYPETRTVSHWNEYTGPANKCVLWLAIVLGTEQRPGGSYGGICVNGKWIWWSAPLGFHGNGAEELASW